MLIRSNRQGLKSAARAQIKFLDNEFEIKASNDGYTIEGYGSVFGTVDSYREVVEPGAFLESIAALGSSKRKLPMLWQHRSGSPIGAWEELKEDGRGLLMRGDLTKGVQLAEEARALLKAGAVNGLSIGYYVLDDSRNTETGVTHLKKLKLVETSVVTFPANDDARVDRVKYAFSNGDLPTIKDFEGFLRCEAGLSRSQARLVVTKGFGELLRCEAGAGDDFTDAGLKEVGAAIDSALSTLRKPLFG